MSVQLDERKCPVLMTIAHGIHISVQLYFSKTQCLYTVTLRPSVSACSQPELAKVTSAVTVALFYKMILTFLKASSLGRGWIQVFLRLF